MSDKKSKIQYDAEGNVISSARTEEEKNQLDAKRGINDEKNPDDFE
ncbi:hypothetical protein [Halobacillus sp. Marseille-Q1614]|nr:hypothetical protein [Halobacillus sp. Marseille-Q1614]